LDSDKSSKKEVERTWVKTKFYYETHYGIVKEKNFKQKDIVKYQEIKDDLIAYGKHYVYNQVYSNRRELLDVKPSQLDSSFYEILRSKYSLFKRFLIDKGYERSHVLYDILIQDLFKISKSLREDLKELLEKRAEYRNRLKDIKKRRERDSEYMAKLFGKDIGGKDDEMQGVFSNLKELRIKPILKKYSSWEHPKLRKYRKISEEDQSRKIPSHVKQKVWKRDGGKCVLCGSTQNLEYDHIIPFSKGGSNSANNIQLLCQRCNREKYNRIM
jgi:5-methylcytosine-specific restriction endonuclease McrA